MLHFEVELERVPAKDTGTRQVFHVISITDQKYADRTGLVKQGKQYATVDELVRDIAHALGLHHDDIAVDEV